MDVDKWLQQLREECKPLPESQVKRLCRKVKELLLQQSNIQPVRAPVLVAGDVHGQFYDVLEMFRIGHEIPNSQYIMIGDFVDRGFNSVETITYLFCLKVKYPELLTLLRGNHECRNTTTIYGFYEQIHHKYGNSNVWRYFNDTFDFLPLGAIIEGKILCVHGGLSPELKTIDQMRAVNRRMEIPHDGPLCDLMWSDPSDISTWLVNSRGAGWLFGEKVVEDFNHINGLELVARAHQLVNEGYQYWFNSKLVTVWSAPNYCYRMGNKASLMKVKEDMEREFLIFDDVPQSKKSVYYRSIMPYFL